MILLGSQNTTFNNVKDNLLQVSVDRYSMKKLTHYFSAEALFNKVNTLNDINESNHNTNEVLYKYNRCYFRKYGNFGIAINENNITQFNSIKDIILNPLTHKLIYIIISEVYKQKITKGIVIKKNQIINLLSYESNYKNIYNRLNNSMKCLRYLLFYEDIKDAYSFLTKLEISHKDFIVDVNPYFLGCVNDFITNKPKKDILCKNGYFYYTISNLKYTKKLSKSAYYLYNFLVSENGNSKLNKKTHKVISYCSDRFINESHINYKQKYKRLLWKSYLIMKFLNFYNLYNLIIYEKG